MKMKVEIINPTWTPVFQIHVGTNIAKGRHGPYKELREAAAKVKHRFGCYSWQSEGKVHYCGSFSKDNQKEEFRTNLEGRVHNYWQNHKVRKNGTVNTNKFVFDQIVSTTQHAPVSLNLLSIDYVVVDKRRFDFPEYTGSSVLVRAVEELLICHYRLLGQCTWNRT